MNIRAYQGYLTNEKKLAPGSIQIATAALRFLYTVTMKRPWDVEEVLSMPKKPQTLPVISSPEDAVPELRAATESQYRPHGLLPRCLTSYWHGGKRDILDAPLQNELIQSAFSIQSSRICP